MSTSSLPRLPWLLILPVVTIQLVAVGPLVTGRATLYQRDVLNTHFEMQGALLHAEGALPALDPYRGGGQPLAGNPNALSYYPTRLLYRLASPWWALNAHFWLHFLLAPWAAYAMARAFGVGGPGAWACGAVYAWSGFFLSQMSHYNLIGGTVLAPLLVALSVRLGRSAGGKVAAGCGATLALLLLAGEPAVAGLALVMSLAALLLPSSRPSRQALAALGLAIAGAVALAWPQVGEMLRLLDGAQRALLVAPAATRGFGSFTLAQVLELLLPLSYGRPDLLGDGSFWGHAAYQGELPLLWSLAPGVVALALVAAAGLGHRRGGLWGWAMVVLGVGAACGGRNPLLAWLWTADVATLLRFPIKIWLWVAAGSALLAGIGFERLFVERQLEPRRRALRTSTALAGVGLLVAALTNAAELRRWLAAALGDGSAAAMAGAARLPTIALGVAGVALALTLVVWASRRPGLPSAGAALVLHAASQLLFLSPLLGKDELAAYRTPPPAAAALKGRTRWTHGAFGDLFGPSALGRPPFPENDARYLARRAWQQVYPFEAPALGVTMELATSPEGLDALLTRLAAVLVRRADDPTRLRLLRGWGVEGVILDRPLHGSTAEQVELLHRGDAVGGEVFVYALLDPLAPVRWVGDVQWAGSPGEAGDLLLDPQFDSRRTVVLAGAGTPLRPAGVGGVRVAHVAAERLELAVEATAPGVVLAERTYLPLWRAAVDGRETAVEVANLHRLAVQVPEGRHLVELWVDRGPLRRSGWIAVLGVASLAAAGVLGRRGAVHRLV